MQFSFSLSLLSFSLSSKKSPFRCLGASFVPWFIRIWELQILLPPAQEKLKYFRFYWGQKVASRWGNYSRARRGVEYTRSSLLLLFKKSFELFYLFSCDSWSIDRPTQRNRFSFSIMLARARAFRVINFRRLILTCGMRDIDIETKKRSFFIPRHSSDSVKSISCRLNGDAIFSYSINCL